MLFPEVTSDEAQTDAVEILHNRYYRGHPDRIAELELARKLDKLEREDD